MGRYRDIARQLMELVDAGASIAIALPVDSGPSVVTLHSGPTHYVVTIPNSGSIEGVTSSVSDFRQAFADTVELANELLIVAQLCVEPRE